MTKRRWSGIPRSASILLLLGCVSGCAPGGKDERIRATSAGSRGPTNLASSSLDDSAAFSTQQFLSHIALLAHDELEGRDTGAHGGDLAAGYIAGQFSAAGLQPGGPGGTYFQPFTADGPVELLEETHFTINDGAIVAALRTDFIPLRYSPQGEFQGEVIFVGYGIVDPEFAHDDYADVDVDGKIVLLLRRAPASMKSAGGASAERAGLEHKVDLAAEHGAAAVLVVNRNPGEDGTDTLPRFRRPTGHGRVPALHIKRALADEMVTAGGLPTLSTLERALEEPSARRTAPLSNLTVRGRVAYGGKKLATNNVIGVLPGMGPHADEYVVIGGHYDHLGIRRGRIHNGADDNASGAAGVMELARAFARAPHRDRGILFMAFSGEEIALLGSRHFVQHPTVALDSIKAMLNLDMIGRLNENDEANMLAIQGLGTGASFQRIVERRAREMNLAFLPEESAKGPSDHDSFYRGGVSSLFFFTGIHADYHQPGDDTEKINAVGGVKVLELVYRIAADLIHEEAAPLFVQVDHPASIARGASGISGGVVMGVRPDWDDEPEGQGWRIAEIVPGGGADRAGLREGDRILSIDGRAIGDFGDYQQALAGKKAGDRLTVTARRGAQELAFEVELSARGAP